MSLSLLDPNAKGGAVAREGFAYQDAFVLQHLPCWLAQSGFSHVVSESMGDVEVCYFCPRGGVRRRAYEAKDYALTESQFWSEVQDFLSMHKGAPDEYVEFCLVCGGYKTPVEPLLNMLNRLRGVGASYPKGSPITTQTREEIIGWIVSKGRTKELAEFIIDRVVFVVFDASTADTSFAGEMGDAFPALDLSIRKLEVLRDQYSRFVSTSALRPVWRVDLEQAAVSVLGSEAGEWLRQPIQLRVEEANACIEDLVLDVSGFVGPERACRTPDDWMRLKEQAEGIASFVKGSRLGNVVGVDVKLRMSMACLLGHVFSAVRGFTLSMRHNGGEYHTFDHSVTGTPFFVETATDNVLSSEEGVACIGFPTSIGTDIERSAPRHLATLPRLTLESRHAVPDMATLNQAVNEAKSSLVQFRSERGLRTIHLIVKAPSVFACLLGHRLNGVGDVQLYDWVDGKYVATATQP